MSFFSRPLTVAATLAPAARPAPGRWIDPRAQRLGAALSGATLVIAYLLGSWLLVAAVGVALAASAFFGTRWFVFSRPWPLVRRRLDLGTSELEHELPPRFAQAMGANRLAVRLAHQLREGAEQLRLEQRIVGKLELLGGVLKHNLGQGKDDG